MKKQYTLALAILGGVAIGGAAVQGLHAQAKPHAFAIIQTDLENADAFAKEFAPVVAKIITDGGGKYLARGGKIVAIQGTAPTRVTVVEFETLEKAQAVFASPAYKDARKIGEKYAKTRVLAVEGIAP